ncbi:hypothetical protein QkW1_19 [Ralstonia phage QkW1]
MKPFNLEAAKAGKPIVASGENYPAHFVAHIPEAEWRSRVVIRVGGSVYVCDEQGRLKGEGDIYIFMVPTKRTVFVNLYRDCGRIIAANETYSDEAQAKYNRRTSSYIGTFPVEIEE